MGLYLSSNDRLLQEYLHKALAKERNVRNMDPDDFGIYIELRDIKKAANICMTEMLFVKRVIIRLEINELRWISNNFERITKSLHKQKELVSAVRKAFSCYKPKKEEAEAIKGLIKDIKKRIDYINAVPIPENIKLTPIQEYIELMGSESFIREFRTEFQTGRDIYESQENGKMDEYISGMMDTLIKAGKAEVYKERLERYIQITKQREEAAKAEKAAEKKAKALNEAQNGILLFREHFFKGVRTLEGSEKIGMSARTLHAQLKKGSRGKFCIICCGFYNDKITYRYVKKDGSLVKSFMSVGLYKTLPEAKKVISALTKLYPEKAFDAVAI